MIAGMTKNITKAEKIIKESVKATIASFTNLSCFTKKLKKIEAKLFI